MNHEKLNRQDKVKRHKPLNQVLEEHGNKRLIISGYMGLCAICHTSYFKGDSVWWDNTKPPGMKIAHRRCWSPKA